MVDTSVLWTAGISRVERAELHIRIQTVQPSHSGILRFMRSRVHTPRPMCMTWLMWLTWLTWLMVADLADLVDGG